MKIYTTIKGVWDGTRYVITETKGFDYNGPVASCCGSTPQQSQALQTQTQLTNHVMQQGQQVFGDSSQIFNDLVNSLSPTVAAGPNQQGFSASELSNLNSQAITQGGQAYQNAKAATGDALAAEGGGNVDLPSGTTAGVEANLASSAAANTANQLSNISLQNYATGRQNYDTALSDLAGATSVFNPSTSLDNSASTAASNQANTANQIAQQNNSWIQGVTGALGNIAGVATGGLIKNLGSSNNRGGSGSANTNSSGGTTSTAIQTVG